MTAEITVRPRPLLSVPQAAREILGIAASTAYEWLHRGELAGAVQIGGHWRVRRSVLEAWLAGGGTSEIARDRNV
jgi:excisionase family DNA binding protein